MTSAAETNNVGLLSELYMSQGIFDFTVAGCQVSTLMLSAGSHQTVICKMRIKPNLCTSQTYCCYKTSAFVMKGKHSEVNVHTDMLCRAADTTILSCQANLSGKKS